MTVPVLRLGVSFPPALCSSFHWRRSPASPGKRQLKPCASRTSGGEPPAFVQLIEGCQKSTQRADITRVFALASNLGKMSRRKGGSVSNRRWGRHTMAGRAGTRAVPNRGYIKQMAQQRSGSWRRTLRLVVFGVVCSFIVTAGIVGVLLWQGVTTDLPPVDRILHYRPPAATRVFAEDGTQIASSQRPPPRGPERSPIQERAVLHPPQSTECGGGLFHGHRAARTGSPGGCAASNGRCRPQRRWM